MLDTLLFYGDSPRFAQDIVGCVPTTSTPNRAQRSARSLCPTHGDVYPHSGTPYALVASSTSSIPVTSMQTVFSPSPLSLSKTPSLIYPEMSPPSQGSGSTPFERQFMDDFSREWSDMHSQISPVARATFYASFPSPAFSHSGGTPLRTDFGQTSKDSHGAVGRVSLIDKFISAAANESLSVENDTPPIFSSQDCCSSLLSDLSDLSPLSSPESSHRSGRGFNSLPTSPAAEKPSDCRQPSIRLTSNSRREVSLRPSTRSHPRAHDPDYWPAKGTIASKRKETSGSRDGDEIQTKRRKIQSTHSSDQTATDTTSSLGTLIRRRLPTDIPYHPQFSLFYLRFPVSSYMRLADGTFPLRPADSKRMMGTYNEPRDALDLYTPRFVKGCGVTKVGVCPICIESPSRGGKGEAVWLSMKFSAYKVMFLLIKNTDYHLQYAHGISSVSARPFSPPVTFRTVERRNPAKNERASILEAKCHKCRKWIPVESVKDMDVKVKELYWWKHAAACHQGHNLEGDDDFFHDDDIYRRAQQLLL